MKANRTNKKTKIFVGIILIFLLISMIPIYNILGKECLPLEILIVITVVTLSLHCILYKNEYSIYDGKIKWKKGSFKTKNKEIKISEIDAIVFTKVTRISKCTFELYKKDKQGKFIYKAFAVTNFKKNLPHLNDIQISAHYRDSFYIDFNLDSEFETFLNEKINVKIYIQNEDYKYLKQILENYASKNLIVMDNIIII